MSLMFVNNAAFALRYTIAKESLKSEARVLVVLQYCFHPVLRNHFGITVRGRCADSRSFDLFINSFVVGDKSDSLCSNRWFLKIMQLTEELTAIEHIKHFVTGERK